MLEIEVISAGMETTIQDGGRQGLMYYGVPRSGFMDRRSAELANALVGKKSDAPLIEMSYKAPQFQFKGEGYIAITGADMNWKLDGQKIELNSLLKITYGSELSGSYARQGFRSYLAIAGEIQNLKYDHGSCSTYSYAGWGGLNGRALQEGDVIRVEESIITQKTNLKLLETHLDKGEILIHTGADFGQLDSKSRDRLFDSVFKVSPDCNRMGARLISSSILRMNPEFKASSRPILPGTIQLLPSGQLIVILQDGQTTGGYPRIAFIPSEELDAFNQLRPGLEFRFLKSE